MQENASINNAYRLYGNRLVPSGVYLIEKKRAQLSAAGLLTCGGKEKLAMFEQSFVTAGKTKRDRTIVLALFIQAVAVTGLVLVPLLGVQQIEAGKRFIILPPSSLKKEPVQTKQTQVKPWGASAPRIVDLRLVAPRRVPARLDAVALSDAPVILGASTSTSASTGEIGGFGDALTSAKPPPVHPVSARKPDPTPIRISSKLSQSQLVYGPKPAYPRLALTARIEGTVRLQATISRDGRIENLHVLSGHPMLTGPAMDAVREWRYQPVLLNGDPVEVITEIEVNFRLSQ